MKIHKEGYNIIIFTSVVLCIIVVIAKDILSQFDYIRYSIYIAATIILFFVVRFFRYPNRVLEEDPNVVYAPADGKIVVNEKIFEDRYLNEERIQLSIFMSPLNVHVNFYPVSGEIIMRDYSEGKKIYAKRPKSSELNEHSVVVIEDSEKRNVLVKQIAGALAQRIVCKAQKGEQVTQGDELGIIKFGSRVDVLLPTNARINVNINEKVKAKKTVLAYLE